jgi:uroporphyrinogen III methyltransferase / synthase
MCPMPSSNAENSKPSEVMDGRPLQGQRVLVTRPQNASDPLMEQLRALGAEVLSQPAIRIVDPPDWRPVDAMLARLDTFDWLVFSSANGVRYLFDRLQEIAARLEWKSVKLRSLADFRRLFPVVKLAAIGPGTADELARRQLPVDLLPEQFRAESLAKSLTDSLAKSSERSVKKSTPPSSAESSTELSAESSTKSSDESSDESCDESSAGASSPSLHGQAKACRLLLIRASRGRETLAEQLAAAGAEVEQVVAYSSIDVETADSQVMAMLAAGRIDWITVTSSAIARSLARLFGETLHRSKLASISPLTSGVLRELGYEPAVEAAEYTMPGLITAMVKRIQTSL